ncbi:MAG: penicillin-binding protein 2 [Spirochaetia bacterium]|nr:penicillin-binding protein 2 [Spirochaetota bacterium]MCX8097338.1 penicillin-binding protein 2 [Spirochaetota bacterium]MDW8112813.1 penicillin-binding protein 2 [Spirochaetia bacterium]
MKTRAWFVFGIFMVVVIIVIIRITSLVVSSSAEKSESDFTGNRGPIYDRNGNVLAISYKTFSLWADASILSDYEKKFISSLVSEYLGVDKKSLMDRLSKNSRFVWLARKVSEDKAKIVVKITNEFETKFGKKGIRITEEYIRRYPLYEKSSTVVGAVNLDNRGISGFEYSLDDVLIEKNGGYGKVYLTIDKYIQEITYLELAKSVRDFEAELGMAVFSKRNGEILSIVDYPSFDPNNLKVIPFNSRVASYIIEPGSVMKLSTVSIALMEFPEISKNIYNCGGSITVFGHTIREQSHGDVSLSEIIAYSCNVGMLKIVERLDDEKLYFFLRKMGFGDKTSVGLPGEERGILRPFNEWSGLSKYMLSIGQEIGVTGLQLLRLGLTIANDGKVVDPRLVKEVILPDGSVKEVGKFSSTSVIPYEVIRKVKMYARDSVVYGTGKLANIPGLEVGGKTGTGQIYNPQGGYYKDQYNAVFLGLVPYNNTQLIGVVILVNPQRLKQGGASSAPTFKRIVEKIVSYNPKIIQTQ